MPQTPTEFNELDRTIDPQEFTRMPGTDSAVERFRQDVIGRHGRPVNVVVLPGHWHARVLVGKPIELELMDGRQFSLTVLTAEAAVDGMCMVAGRPIHWEGSAPIIELARRADLRSGARPAAS